MTQAGSSQPPHGTGQHPRGTLFLVGLYGALFALGWFAFYFLIYLRRGGVTP